jgi:hypothetical protein
MFAEISIAVGQPIQILYSSGIFSESFNGMAGNLTVLSTWGEG